MTNFELLTHELRHRYSGNGFACVEIIDENWCRVTDKYCQSKQALLAARDHLEILEMPPRMDDPPAPVKLTDDDLVKLNPLREGIKNGSIKVVATRFVAIPQPTLA